jgi:hypothetical protein
MITLTSRGDAVVIRPVNVQPNAIASGVNVRRLERNDWPANFLLDSDFYILQNLN